MLTSRLRSSTFVRAAASPSVLAFTAEAALEAFPWAFPPQSTRADETRTSARIVAISRKVISCLGACGVLHFIRKYEQNKIGFDPNFDLIRIIYDGGTVCNTGGSSPVILCF